MISDPSFVEFSLDDIEQTIARRFEKQVGLHPGRAAVKSASGSVAYEELNRKANRIGRSIRAAAKNNAAPAALFFDGGELLIAAGLGAMKAALPYAAIDPRLPEAGARAILASLKCKVVLTDREHFSAVRKFAGRNREVIDIDAIDRALCEDNLNLAVDPDAVAHINFTSGTTGEPKGVVWSHRSELFGIRAKTNLLRIGAADRISVLRANNVGALRDMHLALLNGAAMVSADLRSGGLPSLARWLKEEEVTVFSCVATIFRQAAAGAARAADFAKIRLVHIGGEPVFRSDVELYKKCFPDDCVFAHRYSISETQAVCYFLIDKRTEIHTDHVPVGYATEGSEVSIVGDGGREMENGEIGEIAVRSPYLALGYWRQPGLTREKFIADPQLPGARTYRTGDLGYRLADGCLVHVGRKDFQTKVRGQRVEPEAIEAALHELSSVKQAAVISRKDRERRERLIAYVVPQDRGPEAAELRAQLNGRLPSYMVPSAFVFLKRLPLGAGGKVDRRALPAPRRRSRASNSAAAAPRNALEKVLLKIWQEELEAEALGAGEDFLDLGGDSLTAARIAARVGELFQLPAAEIDLFQTPTVGALAHRLIEREAAPGQAEKIAGIILEIEEMSDAAVLEATGELKGQNG